MDKYTSISSIKNISSVKNIYIFSITDICIPLIIIPTMDFILCMIFGIKTRWFQLHSAINMIIVCIIWDDVTKLFSNPLANIQLSYSKIDSFFILLLHTYHFFIVKRFTVMDYFHHIVFVGCGLVPAIFYYNSNLVRLGWLSTCGLPGAIEYFTLSLVKHNKLHSLKQKRIISYIYNYIRYPITIYCPTLTYIAYRHGLLRENNVYLLVYTNFLLFMNGAFYNKLTIENYIYKVRNP